MSDDGAGAITLVQMIGQHAGRGSATLCASSCISTAMIRATELRRDRKGDLARERQGTRLTEGGSPEICTEFVTDERLATANAAERPEGRSTAFLQVSGCLLRLFGVAERPQPAARLDVVAEFGLDRLGEGRRADIFIGDERWRAPFGCRAEGLQCVAMLPIRR